MVEKLEQNADLAGNPSLPRAYHFSVTIMEVIFVIFLAIICSRIVLSTLNSPGQISYNPIAGATAFNDSSSETGQAFTFLKTADPFYGAQETGLNSDADAVPESTLDVKIFGLRANGEGEGTVILKTQGNLQQLVKIGDEFAPGVKLTAVHTNRIEFRRNGLLETVYLIKDREQNKVAKNPALVSSTPPPNTAPQSDVRKNVERIIEAMDLTPFRNENRIRGFTIGNNAQGNLLMLAGLEVGDIINTINGNELHSWERIREIPDEASNGVLDIQLERRGELLALSFSQSSFGQ